MTAVLTALNLINFLQNRKVEESINLKKILQNCI